MKTTTPSRPGSRAADLVNVPNAVMVHLAGSRRGSTERLATDRLRIGTAANAEIHFSADRELSVSSHHATLHREGLSYTVQAESDQAVWVNGELVKTTTLASGDVLQIGKSGPLLRLRLYKGGIRPYKSMTEIIVDCVDCARYTGQTRFDRAVMFLTTASAELVTQTSPWLRRAVLAFLLLLAISTAALIWRSLQLEERLAGDGVRAAKTSERLTALEARVNAGARAISNATGSVIFLQGAYGFVEPKSRKPLRFLRLGPDGRPLRNPSGEPFVTPEGTGPVVERFFTGTAFVATDDGLLLTNRHVAMPWRSDEGSQALASQGFIPVVHRFVGYLPGVKEPFEVKPVVASDEADVAILRCSGVTGRARVLTLSDAPPRPGEEVIVLGYPTGLRALLARAGERFAEALRSEGEIDFWTVARHLAQEGRIDPLATRGIVGQVSPEAVVYDAETTRGGSGGPVINLRGEVVAVNTAILPEFGGSNLGVPAEQARKLLAAAQGNS